MARRALTIATALALAGPAAAAAAAAPPPESAPASVPESEPATPAPAPAPAAVPARTDPFAPPRTEGRLILSFFGAWLRAGELDALEGTTVVPQTPGQGVAWTELRADVSAWNLGALPLDARIDIRARYDATGLPPPVTDEDGDRLTELDREHWRCGPVTVTPVVATVDPPRCHELDLREASVTFHPGRLRLSAGRLLLAEAGGIQLDGARVGFVPADGWTLGAFGGVVPDFYRRVSFSDYAATISPGGGLFVTARGPASWLAASAGAHLLGATPRIFLFAEAMWRPLAWTDLFAYALLDLLGPEGFTLRNATVRVAVFPEARVRMSVTASHYSALAFREHTLRLLETAAGANNADLFLSSRDELRLRVSVDALSWLTLYGVGRLQRRATNPNPIDPDDPFIETALGGTLGAVARNLGGVRLDASFTSLASFQARSFVVSVLASRELFELVALEAGFHWLHHRDDLGDLDDAADAAAGGAGGSLTRPFDTFTASGTAILTIFRGHFSFLATYELVHDRTTAIRIDSGDPMADSTVNPAWIHLFYARAQVRW